MLEATREKRPAHYHVAVFPKPYARYVANLLNSGVTASTTRYRVRAGDSLWAIARKLGTTVTRLREENGLSSSRILTGQVLDVPIA